MKLANKLIIAAIVCAALAALWYFSSAKTASNSSLEPEFPVVATTQPPEEPATVELAAQPIMRGQASYTESSAEDGAQITLDNLEPAAPKQQANANNGLPSLADSDTLWLQLLERVSPTLSTWLIPEHQIRRWVVLVDNLASNRIPYEHRPLNYPMAEFSVIDTNDDETELFNTANYKRADLLVQTITLIPNDQAVALYQNWLPLFDEAFAELGYDVGFHDRLLQAIDNILAVEPIQQPQQLKHATVLFTYTAEELEQATALEKFLWRLGPENTRKLQNYLQQLQPLLLDME